MSDQPTYQVVPFHVTPLNRESSLVLSGQTRRVCKLQADAIYVLRLCRGERPLRGHVDAVVDILGEQQRANISRLLATLVDVQLLRESSGEPVSPRDVDSVAISTVGIVTADRPGPLARCLASHIDQFARHGRTPRIVVVDDSRNPWQRDATRRAVANAARSYGGVVEYVDRDGKANMRRALLRLGAPLAVLDFALAESTSGFTPGTNRNYLLAMTAGEALLSADDDTVCTTWTAGKLPGIRFSGHLDPRDFAFFASRAEALDAAVTADEDLLGAHERLLGQSLAALHRTAGAHDFTDACEHVFAGLRSSDSARVRITTSGIAGDGALYSPHRLLFSLDARHHWSALDQASYSNALTSRETLRIAQRESVTHESGCMLYSTGLDNRDLVPPFAPSGGNEDGLFGAMLRCVSPATFSGHVPVGIFHDSHRDSPYTSEPMRCVSQVRLSEAMIALLQAWPGAHARATVATQMRRLGEHFAELGEIDAEEFAGVCIRASLDMRCSDNGRSELPPSMATRYPAHWRAGLKEYRERFERSVIDPSFFVPAEFKREQESLDDAFQHMQQYVMQFGQLLQAWPELWSAARELRATMRGEMLTV
jgi:hypothetical protein